MCRATAFLKDDALRELALQGPKDKRGLTRLRAVPKGFEGSRYADPLLEAVARGLKMEKDDLPDMPAPAVNRPGIGPIGRFVESIVEAAQRKSRRSAQANCQCQRFGTHCQR